MCRLKRRKRGCSSCEVVKRGWVAGVGRDQLCVNRGSMCERNPQDGRDSPDRVTHLPTIVGISVFSNV